MRGRRAVQQAHRKLQSWELINQSIKDDVLLTITEGVDVEWNDGGHQPGDENDDLGYRHREQGIFSWLKKITFIKGKCHGWIINSICANASLTDWQHGYEHLIHLEHCKHDHVLHPDHHRDEAVDVAQVRAQAPVSWVLYFAKVLTSWP